MIYPIKGLSATCPEHPAYISTMIFVTECPKIYHKYVLHLLKYTTNLYLSRFAVNFGTLSKPLFVYNIATYTIKNTLKH